MVLSSSVVARTKDGKNLHDVCDHVGSRGGTGLLHTFQYRPKSLEEPLKKVKSETGEPVLVGNHHASDMALEEPFQYGAKAGALVVDSTADVLDEGETGVLCEQACCLPPQVVGLLTRGDPGVHNIFCPSVVVWHVRFGVGQHVPEVATGRAVDRDGSFSCPFPDV